MEISRTQLPYRAMLKAFFTVWGSMFAIALICGLGSFGTPWEQTLKMILGFAIWGAILYFLWKEDVKDLFYTYTVKQIVWGVIIVLGILFVALPLFIYALICIGEKVYT